MITFETVNDNAIASATFIENKFRKTGVSGPIPQKVAVLAHYNSGKTPTENVGVKIESVDDAADRAGLGSMAHRMFQKLFGAIGSALIDVYWFPLAAGTGSSTGTITVAVTTVTAGTKNFYIAGKKVPVIIAAGLSANAIAALIVTAVNADTSLPVTAAAVDNVVTLTAKWTGLSANQITIEADLGSGDSSIAPGGCTFAIVDMAGGSANPSIATALANFGDTFYTFVVCPFNEDGSLDLLEAAGVVRIGDSVKKPFVGVVGYNDTKANYITWLGSRNSPWSTSMPVEGSPNHPAEIAASVAGACAASAQRDPARPFKDLLLYDIMPGTGAEWTGSEKDAIELIGGSAFKLINGAVYIHDLLNTYTTNEYGAADDSWRYAVTITNIQAKYYSMDSVFGSEPFNRGIVVDDNAITSKPYAISPVKAKSYAISLVDYWISQGWSKERDAIVAGIVTEINALNPGRIDILIPDIISVGLRIVAIKYNWAFQAA
jgi:phage tail sheath gpL-like